MGDKVSAGKHANAGRSSRLGIAVAALVVLLVVGLALVFAVGPLDAPRGDNGLVVENAPTGLAQIDRDDGQAEEPTEEEPADHGQEAAVAVPGPSTAGALHVEGAQLMDQTNRPIQLRGVSTHGLAWYPEFVNEQLFQELRTDWGANVVRLALYPADEGGYATGGDRDKLEKRLVKGIEYATAADLYVIVDWHTLSDKNPWWNAEDAKAVLGRVAERFADQDNVLFEICNEPNGETTWSNVKTYANEIIPVIRAANPDAVIITGTPNWSQDLAAAAADPLDFDNVMYSLHFYAATHQQELRDTLKQAVEGGLPVFVTEFGICEASGDGKIDYDSADAWVQLMDELNVSYVCWNLSNKKEAAALIKASSKKTAGFTVDDLSKEGRWLVETLRAPGFDQEALRLADAPKKDNEAGASFMLASDDTLQWTAALSESWQEGGKTNFLYELTADNYSAALDGWSLTIPFSAAVTVTDSWGCEVTVQGSVVTLSNASYNGAVATGGSVGDVGFIVQGPASLAVVENPS